MIQNHDALPNRTTIEFLGIPETVHKRDVNYGEFAIIKKSSLDETQHIEYQYRLLNDDNIAITECRLECTQTR